MTSASVSLPAGATTFPACQRPGTYTMSVHWTCCVCAVASTAHSSNSTTVEKLENLNTFCLALHIHAAERPRVETIADLGEGKFTNDDRCAEVLVQALEPRGEVDAV